MSEATIQDTPARGKSVKGERALETLDFRSRTTGEDAAARSRLVKRLRIALPVLALVLVAAFIFNTRSNSVDQAFLDDFKSMSASTEELRMGNWSFAGVDDDGKPYEVTAVAASQDPAAKDVIKLEKPRAVQSGSDGSSVVTAASGLYRSDENTLTLDEDVTLEHQFGAKTYVLKTPTAIVAIADQVVTSDAGVGVEGPDGATLKADRMRAYREDGRVQFEGNVSMRIYPKNVSVGAPALRDSNGGEDEQ